MYSRFLTSKRTKKFGRRIRKTPVYVSFDYDNDKILKDFIIGQSKMIDSPFSITDWSIKRAVSGNWVADAERRIRRSDVVLVMVGAKTYSAQGVIKEVALARKHKKKIVQVIGYKDIVAPTPVGGAGRLYRWNWDNLKKIMH
ncbi:MAG: TIR domain-containing protein [Halobacteriovoraceae bacterium]|nr:TIR domain-containing protein [Halobacteriovoraceae bacterium]